jgi:RNA polymerase sigma factor (sigma-70 family)
MFDNLEMATSNTHQDRDRFVKENFLPVVWWLMAQGAALDQALDATQQAMIVTCEKWPHRSPHSFARVVAKRVFVDFTRKARTSRKLHDRLTALYDRTPAPAADAKAIFDDEVAHVLGLLAQLPKRQRAVVAYKMDGFSDEEIADLTGQKVVTVRSNLRFARAKLKNLIRERKE